MSPSESGHADAELGDVGCRRYEEAAGQWRLAMTCGLLVMFSVPSMSYGLYKPMLQSTLALQPVQCQDIVSFGLVGGMILGFIPGMLYDRYGYITTLCCGGILAVAGALTWSVLLHTGGAPGSPHWLPLALSFLIMCHGARTQYFAGMCAALSSFPSHLTGSISALMAVLLSLGYIVLPFIWNRMCMSPKATSQSVIDLKPVAKFFEILAIIYCFVTFAGLSIAHKIRPKEAPAGLPVLPSLKISGRFEELRQLPAQILIAFACLFLAFAYTFMTSGIADAATRAKATAEERGSVIFRTGLVGMLGRLVHGVCADTVRSRTPAKRAGTYMAYLSAQAFCMLGYFALLRNLSWSSAAYFVGFGFGGLFALFPASVRMIFGTAKVGFWLGLLLGLVGLLNFLYGRAGVALAFGASFYSFGLFGGFVTTAMFAYLTCAEWGQE